MKRCLTVVMLALALTTAAIASGTFSLSDTASAQSKGGGEGGDNGGKGGNYHGGR